MDARHLAIFHRRLPRVFPEQPPEPPPLVELADRYLTLWRLVAATGRAALRAYVRDNIDWVLQDLRHWPADGTEEDLRILRLRLQQVADNSRLLLTEPALPELVLNTVAELIRLAELSLHRLPLPVPSRFDQEALR
ncbi:MAG TPA: hypothetical protein VGN26_12615 [Armatimonadota bacterium]|jgi:hypothetical protein